MKAAYRGPVRGPRQARRAHETPPSRAQLGLLAIGLELTSVLIGAVERWPSGRRAHWHSGRRARWQRPHRDA